MNEQEKKEGVQPHSKSQDFRRGKIEYVAHDSDHASLSLNCPFTPTMVILKQDFYIIILNITLYSTVWNSIIKTLNTN